MCEKNKRVSSVLNETEMRKCIFGVFPLCLTRAVMQVSCWLETVFGAEGVLDFEVNTRTIELLDQLVQISELRCKEVSLLTDDYSQKAAEYSSDGIQSNSGYLYIHSLAHVHKNHSHFTEDSGTREIFK